MEITEVRVKLVNVKNDKLRAFCSITVDNDFVVRDLKIIEGAKGAFVAMPSRKLTDRCPRCGGKNHYRARFCNDCGARLSGDRGVKADRGNQKLHTDIAHPINSKCREAIQKRILDVYQEEIQKSSEPGYKPMEYDIFDEEALVEESSEVLQDEVEGEAPPIGEKELGLAEGAAAEEAPERLPQPASQSQGVAENRGGYRSDGRREGDRRFGRSERGGDRGRFRRGPRRSRDDRQHGGRGESRRRNGGGRPADRSGDGGREQGYRGQPGPEVQGPGSAASPGSPRGSAGTGEGRWQPSPQRGSPGGSEGLGIPENDREKFLPGQPAAGAQVTSPGTQTPPASHVRQEPEAEPEDNFGEGLFT